MKKLYNLKCKRCGRSPIRVSLKLKPKCLTCGEIQ